MTSIQHPAMRGLADRLAADGGGLLRSTRADGGALILAAAAVTLGAGHVILVIDSATTIEESVRDFRAEGRHDVVTLTRQRLSFDGGTDVLGRLADGDVVVLLEGERWNPAGNAAQRVKHLPVGCRLLGLADPDRSLADLGPTEVEAARSYAALFGLGEPQESPHLWAPRPVVPESPIPTPERT